MAPSNLVAVNVERSKAPEVIERPVDRSELHVCDETFFTGTMAEVAPVIRVDHRPVGTGEIGPLTARLRHLYTQAAHGQLDAWRHWLMPVYDLVPAQSRA